jgi:hypothetical protein
MVKDPAVQLHATNGTTNKNADDYHTTSYLCLGYLALLIVEDLEGQHLLVVLSSSRVAGLYLEREDEDNKTQKNAN